MLGPDLTSAILLIFLTLIAYSSTEKYKVCVVDGKGGHKKSSRYCPILDRPESQVECVVGLDRLDCLRRMSKGKVDFTTFTPEDLVTAHISEFEMLITNELRYTEDKNEYEVVAVVDKKSDIKSKHDLKNKRYCHPGYGYETDWTRILSNYFEASVVPQLCDSKLSVRENRIKASANYFKKSCKAGPWVEDPDEDLELKSKYKNLCELCDTPAKCNTQDKYWGRRGSLFCLTDGAGDISWARLDDVKVHFGLTKGGQEAPAENYNFLCKDDYLLPLSTSNPCVWVVKPWPVVASRREIAQEIQAIVNSLPQSNYNSWQYALLDLISDSHVTIKSLEPVEPIENYLNRATGFLSANSFSGCHPPRTIKICTTSITENAKCAWIRETAAVYGIEPDLDCLKASDTTECLEAVKTGAADLVIVHPDYDQPARKKYGLEPLFYETVDNPDKYIVFGTSLAKSQIEIMEDLKGKRAVFPRYEGVAWTSVCHILKKEKFIDSCENELAMSQFFGPSCVQEAKNISSSLIKLCEQIKPGEFGAIQALIDEVAEVAFISKKSLLLFLEDPKLNVKNLTRKDFGTVGHGNEDRELCFFSWAPAGQAMVRSGMTSLWKKDTLDVFLHLDALFGKNYKSITTPLTLYGKFDDKSDVLFHDATVRIRTVPRSKNTDTMSLLFYDLEEKKNTSAGSSFSIHLTLLSLVMFLRIYL